MSEMLLKVLRCLEPESWICHGQGIGNIIAKAIFRSSELGSYPMPNQVVNYVEAHDNYNLHGLTRRIPSTWWARELPIVDLNRQQPANILMQGLAFMEPGQEFRTKLVGTESNGQVTTDKERAMNSYNAPDRQPGDGICWNIKIVSMGLQDYPAKTTMKEFSYSTYEEI